MQGNLTESFSRGIRRCFPPYRPELLTREPHAAKVTWKKRKARKRRSDADTVRKRTADQADLRDRQRMQKRMCMVGARALRAYTPAQLATSAPVDTDERGMPCGGGSKSAIAGRTLDVLQKLMSQHFLAPLEPWSHSQKPRPGLFGWSTWDERYVLILEFLHVGETTSRTWCHYTLVTTAPLLPGLRTVSPESKAVWSTLACTSVSWPQQAVRRRHSRPSG